MQKVEKMFNDYEEYLGFLRNCTTCDDPDYTANHERAHLQKAQVLGYEAIYGARIIGNDFPHILLEAFVDFPGQRPTSEHFIEILLAPDIPGEDDIELIANLNKEVLV